MSTPLMSIMQLMFNAIDVNYPWRHIHRDIGIPRPKSRDIEIPGPKSHGIVIPRYFSRGQGTKTSRFRGWKPQHQDCKTKKDQVSGESWPLCLYALWPLYLMPLSRYLSVMKQLSSDITRKIFDVRY